MNDPHLSVLLAHNDTTTAHALQLLLQGMGHRVLLAHDAASALVLLEQERPQLLLVQASLDEDGDENENEGGDARPGAGLALVQRVRQSPHNGLVPVLVLGESTPHADAGTDALAAMAAAIDAGADDWIAAPPQPRLLALRVRALQRAAATHSGLQGIIDNVVDAIVVIEGRGRIKSFNAAAEELFGYDAGEVLGHNVSMLMPSPYREQHDVYLANHLRTRQAHIIGTGRQLSGLRRNGTLFPMNLSVTVVKGAAEHTFIGVVRDLTAEHERAHFAHLALHDTLTGLPNRAQFTSALENASRRANQSGESFALLFVDVDRFKEINDELGHAAGDAVLSTIAGRLRHSVGRQDLVARLAGDEFVVLLRGVNERGAARRVAARLREAVAAAMVFGDSTLQVQISVGVAVHGSDGDDAAMLLSAADQAMYRNKASTAAAAGTARAAND